MDFRWLMTEDDFRTMKNDHKDRLHDGRRFGCVDFENVRIEFTHYIDAEGSHLYHNVYLYDFPACSFMLDNMDFDFTKNTLDEFKTNVERTIERAVRISA